MNSLRAAALGVQNLGLWPNEVPVCDPVAIDRACVHQHQLLLDPGNTRDADALEESHPLERFGRRIMRTADFDVGDLTRVAIDIHDAGDHITRVDVRDDFDPERFMRWFPLPLPVRNR